MLAQREWCVTEIVAAANEKFSTISQRLRILRAEGLLTRRRDGKHIYYSLADQHVADLIHNALAHADELRAAPARSVSTGDMTSKEGVSNVATIHADHDHRHGPGCGHTGIKHEGHVDYLHDGHLHHVGSKGVEEHGVAVSSANPAECTPKHDCNGHPKEHKHGPGCGHEVVPHGDHNDYLVDGHLHHPHGNHCDDHGKVQKA
jgi:hypothetical protein